MTTKSIRAFRSVGPCFTKKSNRFVIIGFRVCVNTKNGKTLAWFTMYLYTSVWRTSFPFGVRVLLFSYQFFNYTSWSGDDSDQRRSPLTSQKELKHTGTSDFQIKVRRLY